MKISKLLMGYHSEEKAKKKRKLDPLTFKGQEILYNISSRKNLDKESHYWVLTGARKGAFLLFDSTLAGAVIVLLSIHGQIKCDVSGEITVRGGWFLTIHEITMIDSEGKAKSIREYAPKGDIKVL